MDNTNTNKNQSNDNKPILYYALVVFLVMMVLNAFVFPLFVKSNVTEIGYSDFLKMVDNKEVKEVVLSSDYIVFTAEENGEKKTYQTAVFPDNELIERLENAGVEFSSYIEPEESPLTQFIFSWIIPILLFSILGRVMFSIIQKKGGLNAMSFGQSNAKIYAENETGVSFKDVQGEDEAKEALEEIVNYLHNSDKYTQIGAKLPKGALLVGPPGTGKTLLARAVAGEAKVPFFSISGSEFVEMFVGMGASKVRDLFKQASQKAPCIVFIDEIDTIGKKRDSSPYGGNDEREQTLNQLLTEMDGFDANKGVVILAATNRPDSLDPALLRPGRFDRRIPVNLPDLEGRVAILKVHAKDVKMDANIDFKAIARATSGASGAELANIINEAALRAVRSGRESVTQDDLEESVETVIAGYVRKNSVLSEDEKKIVSYHEIGHALVAAKQTNSAPVTKITIVPRTSGALGYTMQVDQEEKNLMSQEELLNKIATLTGGQAAEELIFNSITTGASNDIETATKLARSMVTQYGMSSTFGMVALETVTNQYLGGDTSLVCSAKSSEEIDDEVIRIIKEAREKAMNILKENEAKLKELASFLLEKETITGEEFMSILNSTNSKG